jgi:cystathionine gamma-lyase
MAKGEMRIDTKVIHAGQAPEPQTGAVMPPIFMTSTYAQTSPGVNTGYEYSRPHNPTRFALERMIARLEGSTLTEQQDLTFGGFAFASGLASILCVLEMLDAGGTVVAMDDLYGGTGRLFTQVRQRSAGLNVRFVDMTRPGWHEGVLDPSVGLVWVETPTNPLMKLVDLSAVARVVREKAPKAILACDNTFATPIFQRPIEHGFDIAMHSATKYLNGHSDVIGGMLATNRADLAERLRYLQNALGVVPGPFDSYMVLRGIKTLAVRMARHHESAQRIAEWLEGREMVERVVFPGLPSHPQHALFSKQMTGSGGMISFFIRGGLDAARAFLENTRLFTLAESLGGVESLVNHPVIMTHASVPAERRAALGITVALIRLSVGIEHCDDLIADLERAFDAAAKVAKVRT